MARRRSSRRRGGGGLALVVAILVALAVGVLIGWAAWHRAMPDAHPTPVTVPVPGPTPATAPAPTPKVADLLPDERLAAAERAAFPDGTGVENKQGVRYDFTTSRLVDTPFGAVLVSEGVVPDAAHADPGRLDAAYLRPDGAGYALAHNYPAIVVGGSSGQLGDWQVSDKYGRYPVVVAKGSGTFQGYTCTRATLEALRPGGPAELAAFTIGFDNGGAGEETSRSTQGTIVDIVPDQSFTVRFTGSRTFDAHYVRHGGKYRLQDGPDAVLSGC